MNDKLIICSHCGSDACYEFENSPIIKTYSCFGCGFTSNTLMKEGEDFYNEQIKTLPDLHKAVMFTDQNGLVWFPTTINMPQNGMVFYNGTNPENAKWAAVKSVKVTEEEKEKYPIRNQPGKYYEWRMAMETMKSFETKEFLEALSYIGISPN